MEDRMKEPFQGQNSGDQERWKVGKGLKKIRRLFRAIQYSAYKSSLGEHRDFPGSPVVKTLYFHCRGRGSIPGQGTRSPMCVVQPEKVRVGGQEVGAEQSKGRKLSKNSTGNFPGT